MCDVVIDPVLVYSICGAFVALILGGFGFVLWYWLVGAERAAKRDWAKAEAKVASERIIAHAVAGHPAPVADLHRLARVPEVHFHNSVCARDPRFCRR